MWKSIKSFSTRKAGNIPGECLKNVRQGFGIPAKYGAALEAWQHTQQHKDKSWPSGVDTPLFFTYKNDGHIGVHLSNGEFWSDGHTYSSLAAYQESHTPKYLGWGESVNDVRVIQSVASKPASKPGYYKVVSGDTLSEIANKYRLSLKAIEKLNMFIKDPNNISIGELIRVK